MSTCRSCSAPIRWVKLGPSFKPHPLDLGPCDEGNIAVDDGFGDPRDPRAAVVSKAELESTRASGTPLYRSHFATCPKASEHRKARK